MDIEHRIQRLERHNRLLRAGLLGIVLVTSAGLLLGANFQKEAPARIEAKEFVLVDKDGKERGALRVVEESFGTVVQQGPFLILTDSQGNKRLEMGCREGNNSTNQVELAIKNKSGNTQIGAFAMNELNNQASFYLRHESGAGVDLSALPNLAEVEVTGKRTLAAAGAKMFATQDARGYFVSNVKTGDGVATTIPEIRITHEGDKNTIILYDINGQPIWKQP